MKTFRLILLLFIILNTANAQVQLSGKVNEIDQSPLSFANVLLLQVADSSLVKGTISDENGAYLLENIEAGNYLLNVSMVGYETYYSTPILFSDENQKLDVTLQEASTRLSEITVTARKPFFEQKIDRTVVNVQNSIVATGSNALTILERSPGIEVDRMNNQIRMQGKNGVIVMLDGKMMRMDEQGLIQLLNGMPSDNIISIELITTPPASFDAEGNAGIINIKTKKQGGDGYSSTFTLNTGYGERPKFGGSFAINYRKNKLNLFADVSANYNRTQEDATISRLNIFDGVTTSVDLLNRRPADRGLYNYRFGLDYSLSERTVLGAMVSGYWSTWDMKATTESVVASSDGEGFTSKLNGHEINNWTHWMTNFNLRHRFLDNSSLNIDFDYLYFYDDNPTDYLDNTFDQNGQLISTNEFISRKETPVDFQVLKIDYTKPLSEKVNLELGVKGTLTSFINDLRLANLASDGNFIDDPLFTDVYNLREELGAVYGSLDIKPSSAITIKAGLRYEYYDSDLLSDADGNVLLQSYGRFFPTVNFSYQISDKRQLSVSYSERITRPSIGMIAPAFYFWGYNTILGGNPAVRPTISRNINGSYRWNTLLFQVQFSDIDNALIYLPTVLAEENIVFTQAENMPNSQTALFAINFPLNFFPWWESRFNAAANWLNHETLIEGQTISQSNWYVNANTTHTFKLPKDFSLELSGRLRTGFRWTIGEVPFNGSFDLGIKKQLSPKASLTLNWTDVLNTGSFFEIDYSQPELNIFYDWYYEMEGSIVRLNFSYNFGNEGIKQRENRSTGSEEERGRVN